MKKVLLFLIFATVLLSSCSDEALLDRNERRLTGTWKFERVTFREDWAISRDHVLGFYEGDRITFNDDYTAIYSDDSRRALFDGDWSIFLGRGDDGNDNVNIEVQFYDHINDEIFSYFAEVTFLTHRKMKMTVFTDDGRYRYKLLKD